MPNFRCPSTTSEMTSVKVCGFKSPRQSYIKAVCQPQKPKQCDNHFVPGPKGAQRVTGQASCPGAWQEKCLISADADSFHSQGKFRSNPVPKHIKLTSW